MRSRAEQIFDELQTAAKIRALIGQSEDAHLDCKEWPSNENEMQKVLAKAACGLTNAEGGVVVIGMKAKSVAKDEPDLIDSAVLVADKSAIRSRTLDLIGQLVEPGIEGVRAKPVLEIAGGKSGFVVLFIPASEGPPRRSRKDWKFYLRIGSGTFPMEYFQIEERFGRSPRPKLELYLENDGVRGGILDPGFFYRWFVLGLKNAGRGIAKFPSIRFGRACGLHVDTYGIDGSLGFGLPVRPSEQELIAFRGGLDDVIYPGELRKVAFLRQNGQRKETSHAVCEGSQPTRWFFKQIEFLCEISCEGLPTTEFEKTIPEESSDW
jgi:hypothetical protein